VQNLFDGRINVERTLLGNRNHLLESLKIVQLVMNDLKNPDPIGK
jgi:hypothetical protein